jgi:methionyl-tRNA synthetase
LPHTAFLDRLGSHLNAVSSSLSPDGFSLNRAAAEVDDLVTDAVRFAEEQDHTRDTCGWADENRTTTALELAAAGLLAVVAAPLLPRFADRLARGLGFDRAPAEWPSRVSLLAPGAPVNLAGTQFFSNVGNVGAFAGAPGARPVPTRASA